MRLCKPHFEILEQQPGLEGIYKSIELVGRVSHKSEDRITEDSAKTFVERMVKMKHLSTCEFGTVYLKIDNSDDIVLVLNLNPYTKCKRVKDICYVTTNLRVLIEHNATWLLLYMCEPTEYHEKRYTVKFICDRAILAEFTRHRKFSFMAESTRYCNYSKNKFNNELTFIQPIWTYHQEDGDYGTIGNLKRKNVGNKDGVFYDFIKSLQYAEFYYLSLINQGWKPEQARNVLPLSLKTELYMCGFAEDWEKFFELRCAANAHPQARELAIPLKEEFTKRKFL